MAFDKIILPEKGEQITIGDDGVFDVPNEPIVTFIDDEALHAGMSHSVQRVLDAAVESAYNGERKIAWVEVAINQPELIEDIQDYPIGIQLASHITNISSVLFTGSLMLGRIGWVEAAELVQQAMNNAYQGDVVPVDSELNGVTSKVPYAEFCDTVISHMGAGTGVTAEVEADQYDELADKFHEEFEAGAEKTAEFAQKAMEKAREQLTVAGKFTEEQGHKLKEFLENDFSRVSQEMKKGAKEKLNPSRLGAGALSSMSKLLHKTGVALSSFADKADGALACKSGEITSAGKLKCNACNYEMNFKKTGRIPPCPKCHKTEFTKGY